MCQKVLGHKKHHHKEWINIETLDRIQETKKKKTAINDSRTRAGKFKAQAKYTEANKQVKKSIETNKQKYMEKLAVTEEKAAGEGNMRQLCDTPKILAGKYNKQERPVKKRRHDNH
ncbi:unnamed protein product [Schistosoma curassoni]|uniref:GN3L_Grn1 domain-containing protein n=1 Tax=Schistosoma curassoni TaxID=6186 RepID=A0A183JGS4_9TREM|nr:unnamed protein product [Schistosoma curassoni]